MGRIITTFVAWTILLVPAMRGGENHVTIDPHEKLLPHYPGFDQQPYTPDTTPEEAPKENLFTKQKRKTLRAACINYGCNAVLIAGAASTILLSLFVPGDGKEAKAAAGFTLLVALLKTRSDCKKIRPQIYNFSTPATPKTGQATPKTPAIPLPTPSGIDLKTPAKFGSKTFSEWH